MEVGSGGLDEVEDRYIWNRMTSCIDVTEILVVSSRANKKRRATSQELTDVSSPPILADR